MSRRPLGAAALAAAALFAAGCGGGDEQAAAPAPAPATAPAAAVAPISAPAAAPGEPVRAGSSTPAPVARALAGTDVIVVAFLLPGAADDQAVAAALERVRGGRDGERGVTWFVYRVGRDRDFGGLADQLGVTGTPSVAVIARNRTLHNLWTGLVDADILRQSISDARATAVAAGAGQGGGPVAGSTTGSPAGIALAREVNAAYEDVAGVEVSGELAVGGEAMRIDGEVALRQGAPAGMRASFSARGVRFDLVTLASEGYVRASTASCWARLPGTAAVAAAAADPLVPTADARFSAPRGGGGRRLLLVEAGGRQATYVVDGRTLTVSEVRMEEGTLRFTTLDEAPDIAPPGPVCDDPTEALDGLPEALAGTAP